MDRTMTRKWGKASTAVPAVVALALLLTFAFAAAAMASTSSGYLTWDAALDAYNKGVTGLTNESPHQSYQLTTRKCGVCHAVHKATAGGELLLKSSRASACDYCHVSSSGGYKQVYASNPANYGGSTSAINYAHDYACVNCHAVHGAQTLTSTVIANAILRDLSSRTTTVNGVPNQPYRVANAPASWKTSTSNRNEPITWFCSQCHQYYTSGNPNNDVTQYRRNPDGSYYTTAAATHPMVADNTFDYTTRGTVSNSANVAFAGAQYCRSCHDAGTDGSDTATSTTAGAEFPHYTPGYPRFLEFAAYAGATPQGDNGTTPSVAAQWDGACLKCHRGSATTGVGFDY